MYLVEQHVFKKSTPAYAVFDEICFKNKNLYNAVLYRVRQEYIKNKKYINYNAMSKLVKQEELPEYRALPAASAEWVLKLVDKNFQSFFALLKKKKKGGTNGYDKPVKIPHYLDKEKGRFVATYPINVISKKFLRDKGVIKLSQVDITVKTNLNYEQVKQVRIVPRHSFYVFEVLYKVDDVEKLKDNGRYAAIDIGVSNLATVAFNCEKPFIINGKPIKAINQFFNKKVADLQSKLKGNKKTSNLIHSITRNRNNKIKTYLHKASRYVADFLRKHDINILFIGKNDGWKQEVNIGKKNNQNFVQIPHAQFIQMLHYKCELYGINVYDVPESYTSKCSFFDNEPIKKKADNKYLGKRIKRGLFRTAKGWLINADYNGAMNIMRRGFAKIKESAEFSCDLPPQSPEIITLTDETECRLYEK